MSQRHEQHGTFHVTTNTFKKVPWCTLDGVPQILIDNLVMTKNVHKGFLHGFCILPNHMHILLCPGEKGLSAFMQSFKSNASRDLHEVFANPSVAESRGFPLRGERLWQKGFHDERIRDTRQRSAALGYIEGNAAKDGLADKPSDWPWTSIHHKHLLDSMEVWLN